MQPLTAMTLHLVERLGDPHYIRMVDVILGTSSVVRYDELTVREGKVLVMSEGLWLALKPMFGPRGFTTRVMSYAEEQRYGVRCKCRFAPRPY